MSTHATTNMSTATASRADTLQVRVWRGGASGSYENYQVPRNESQTVLDVVTYIQRDIDPTLSYRFACRVGMCGSCAMTVNGEARWTCRTHVRKVVGTDGRLDIGPLSNMPIIKDLATDMSAFFDKWARAKGQFSGSQTRHDPMARVEPESTARRAANAGIECIGCGVCYASCDVVSWRPDYLGPAALNRAWTLVNDVRDTATVDRLRAVAGDAGCHACHSHFACTERCPKGISPTAGISGLKRLVGRLAAKGEL